MDTLASVCDRVASYSSRLRKIAILAEYFRGLSDKDLERAVHFLCCGPRVEGGRTLSVGWATLREAVMGATGWDEEIYHLCMTETGDAGEAAGLLIADHTRGEAMTLARAEELYAELARARQTAARVRTLRECLTTYRPGAVKYFVKIIGASLRIGLQTKMIEEAVAAATETTLNEVRAANNRLGDLAAVAVAARHQELAAIEAKLFHPMDFMLAKPLDAAADIADPENWVVEDKYDGIRSQIHFADGRVLIYTRGMDEVTHAFPEIEAAMAKAAGSAVVDGEVLAWRDGRALPFTVLQQRIARKRVTHDMLAAIPVAFMAYDILLRDGAMLVDRPIEERRAILEEALGGQPDPILISPQFSAATAADIDHLFEDARLRGDEGLVLKRRASVYEPGRRSGAWSKMKRPYATLDVVVTAAERGHGKRATVLSDYTFAVRSGERFLNVGKAYSGLTDAEIRELTRILQESATGRYGSVLAVRPEVVLEVAFDGIQKSPRHKSGFALRFPRIVRWRKDKTPAGCDDLDRVQALYESSLNLTASRE
jgi:ATP-dependent DNA ligase